MTSTQIKFTIKAKIAYLKGVRDRLEVQSLGPSSPASHAQAQIEILEELQESIRQYEQDED